MLPGLAYSWKFRRAGGANGSPRESRRWSVLETLSDFKSTAGSLEFMSGMKRLYQTMWFWPPRVSSRRNAISRAILEGRRRRRTEPLVDLDRVNRFYSELVGSAELLNSDERFLAFIDRAV